MSLIAELEYERNRYYKLRDDIKMICIMLTNSTDHLDDASIELDKYYQLEDNAVDNKVFKNTIKDINSIYEVLNETIIPNINNKIEQLSNEISKLQIPIGI